MDRPTDIAGHILPLDLTPSKMHCMYVEDDNDDEMKCPRIPDAGSSRVVPRVRGGVRRPTAVMLTLGWAGAAVRHTVRYYIRLGAEI
jgi:hypothetical protein